MGDKVGLYHSSVRTLSWLLLASAEFFSFPRLAHHWKFQFDFIAPGLLVDWSSLIGRRSHHGVELPLSLNIRDVITL